MTSLVENHSTRLLYVKIRIMRSGEALPSLQNVKKAIGGHRIYSFFYRIIRLILPYCLLYIFHDFVLRRQPAEARAQAFSKSNGANRRYRHPRSAQLAVYSFIHMHSVYSFPDPPFSRFFSAKTLN